MVSRLHLIRPDVQSSLPAALVGFRSGTRPENNIGLRAAWRLFHAAMRGFKSPRARHKFFISEQNVTPSPQMPDRDRQNPSRRGSLAALGVVVFLFVIGWILAHELYSGGKLEDCLMSGRTNCTPLDTQSH
jgi:hypothetical protein